MAEVEWEIAPRRRGSRAKDQLHTATVLGLQLEVATNLSNTIGVWADWRISGFFDGMFVLARDLSGYERGRTREQAQHEAEAAARRLYAAGWRGTKAATENTAGDAGDQEGGIP